MPGMQYTIKIKTFSMNAVKLFDATKVRLSTAITTTATFAANMLISNGYSMHYIVVGWTNENARTTKNYKTNVLNNRHCTACNYGKRLFEAAPNIYRIYSHKQIVPTLVSNGWLICLFYRELFLRCIRVHIYLYYTCHSSISSCVLIGPFLYV